MKKITRLRKKLTVRTLSFIMAAGLLLLVVPFVAIAADREDPEPGKIGDFRLLKEYFATTQVTLKENMELPPVIVAEDIADAGNVTYQWQAYSTEKEKYVDVLAGKKIVMSVERAAKYGYGNGKSYFRCLATTEEGNLLVSDVLTVVLPVTANEGTDPAEGTTIATIDLLEPTQPGETGPTGDEEPTGPTAPTTESEVSATVPAEETTAPTVTTTASTEETTSPTTAPTQPADEESDPPEGSLIVPDDAQDEEEIPVRGMLLAPLLRGVPTVAITFDCDGGSGVNSVTDAEVGSSLRVGTPGKVGSVFTGWIVTSPDDLDDAKKSSLATQANNGNLTVPEHPVTFKATWMETTVTTANYTIEYWLQDANDDDYTLYSSTTVTGANVGSTVALSSEQLLFPDTTIRAYVSSYLSRSDTGAKVIKADGSTTFYVYFDRKVYNITIDVGLPRPRVPPEFGNHSLTFSARLGQNIYNYWPDATWVINQPRNGYNRKVYFYYVKSDSQEYRNKPATLTRDIIDASNGNKLSIVWNTSNGTRYRFAYRFQKVDGNVSAYSTDYESNPDFPDQTVTTEAFMSASSFAQVEIEGFQYVHSTWSWWSGFTFYYKRQTYNLHYVDTNMADASYIYGASLTRPADPTKTGCTFIGWYKDADFEEPMPDDWSSIHMPAHDYYVYARWMQPTNVSVTAYLTNTSSDPLTTVYTIAGTPALPNNAISTCTNGEMKFRGWKNKADNTPFVFNSTVVSSNIEIYGVWGGTAYNLTIEPQNGEPTKTVEVDYDTSLNASNVSELTAPSKAGYTFGGWYTDEGCTDGYEMPTTMPDNDLTVYAKWTVNSHTLTIHKNNGETGDPATATVDYDTSLNASNVSELATPSKAGYTFGGWYTDADCTTSIPTTMPDNDLEIFAKWNKKRFTVEFYNNEHFYDGDLAGSKNVLYDETVMSDTGISPWHASVPRARFDKWMYYNNGTPTEFLIGPEGTHVISNMKVYATWVNLFTVQFVADYHSPSVLYEDENVDEGSTFAMPAGGIPTPTKEGFTFREWYYDDNGTPTPFKFANESGATPINADTTVYPVWDKNEVTLIITNRGDGDEIFTVAKEGFSLRVVVPTGQSVTIAHLPFGSYTVSSTGWEFWNRYTMSGDYSFEANAVGQTFNCEAYSESAGFNWLGGSSAIMTLTDSGS